MISFRPILIPFLAGMVLFIYGLNIPKVSLTILAIAVIAVLFRSSFNHEFDRAFMTPLFLLFLFALSYYLFTTMHGITTLKEGARNVFVITGAYMLGFSTSVGRGSESVSAQPFLLLMMIAGFSTFAFLSVYFFMQEATLVQITERIVANFWNGVEINAPSLGACGSLGMCLLPVVLFGGGGECWPTFTSVERNRPAQSGVRSPQMAR